MSHRAFFSESEKKEKKWDRSCIRCNCQKHSFIEIKYKLWYNTKNAEPSRMFEGVGACPLTKWYPLIHITEASLFWNKGKESRVNWTTRLRAFYFSECYKHKYGNGFYLRVYGNLYILTQTACKSDSYLWRIAILCFQNGCQWRPPFGNKH